MRSFRGMRSVLYCHSLTQTVKNEVLENQYGLLSTIDVQSKMHDDMNLIVFLQDVTPIVCIAYLTWFSTDKQVRNLDNTLEYKKTRTILKVSVLILLYVFFKNVENAI
jgi:hypothetical protein